MKHSESGATDVAEDEIVQVNVRLRRPRVDIARRIAAAHDETLTAYIDRLLADDMNKESESLLRRFDEEEQAVRSAREAALREMERRSR